MKNFKSTAVVRFPLDLVWATMRDELPQLALLMKDVASISAVDRIEVAGGTIHVTNLWESRQQLPAIVANFLSEHRVTWIDKAQWIASGYECQWSIEPKFLPRVTKCSGRTLFEAALGKKGTRITFEGTLEVDPRNIPGLPSLLAGTVGKVSESFVTGLIPKNFHNLTDAVSKFLASQA